MHILTLTLTLTLTLALTPTRCVCIWKYIKFPLNGAENGL